MNKSQSKVSIPDFNTEEVVLCPVGGKRSHATAEEAQRALHKLRKKRKGLGRRVRSAYLHKQCGAWHLTSMPQRKGST